MNIKGNHFFPVIAAYRVCDVCEWYGVDTPSYWLAASPRVFTQIPCHKRLDMAWIRSLEYLNCQNKVVGCCFISGIREIDFRTCSTRRCHDIRFSICTNNFTAASIVKVVMHPPFNGQADHPQYNKWSSSLRRLPPVAHVGRIRYLKWLTCAVRDQWNGQLYFSIQQLAIFPPDYLGGNVIQCSSNCCEP